MTTASVDRFAELRAPAHWQAVDFISDLHLQPGEPDTVQSLAGLPAHALRRSAPTRCSSWETCSRSGSATTCWTGQARSPATVRAALKANTAATRRPTSCAATGTFLLGERALSPRAACRDCQDPTVLDFQHRRWLLSHGDALCLDDTDYLQFRAQVRSPKPGRAAFLSRPLAEREALARDLRQRSEARKRSQRARPRALGRCGRRCGAGHWLTSLPVPIP